MGSASAVHSAKQSCRPEIGGDNEVNTLASSKINRPPPESACCSGQASTWLVTGEVRREAASLASISSCACTQSHTLM
jgi:hypothetical protein